MLSFKFYITRFALHRYHPLPSSKVGKKISFFAHSIAISNQRKVLTFAFFTWTLWWHTLPVHRTEFLPRTHPEAHWPAFSAFRRSGSNIWWPRNSSDGGQSSTRCGRGQSIGYAWTDHPVTYPETDWVYEFGSHIADHPPER